MNSWANIKAIMKRELGGYFTSPIAYVFLVIFLLLTGFFTFTVGNFFERGEAPLIRRIAARIAALQNWPVDKGEGLQVLHYRNGAQYLPHFDYFHPPQPGTPAVLARGGQRLATLLMYLSTPDRGGTTVFPDLGLEVAPTKGHAVFFSYARPHPSTQTLHGGAPVTLGEKWVATKWLREGVFT